MNKAYDKVVWVNAPSTSSPLNQTNLNKMSNALDTIDDRVIDLDSGKVGSVTVTNTLPTGTTLATITVDGTATTIKGSDITVDDEMSTTSENPVQNKVIYAELQNLLPEEEVTGNPISISDASGLSAKSCSVAFGPVQAGSGDPSPENVRPITGWTELNVARYGINLATTEIYKQGYVLGSDGSESANSNYCITKKIFIEAGKKYILRFKENSGALSDNAIRIGFYKADGTFKSRSVLINGSPAITIENDVAFLCFSYVNASTSANYKWDLMFNEGETPLDYVPYQGQTHTATLGSTYYGGSYDFVSGKLIVEWVAVDMGSIDYVVSESGKFRYMPSNGIISDGVGNPANDFMCSIYKNQTNVVISSANVANLNVAKTSSPTYASYYFRNDNYSTKEAFKTAMSGQTFCYKLATPLEITLTAHEIALLKGQNVLWSDSNGNITLTYSADIKAYIDSKISQLS